MASIICYSYLRAAAQYLQAMYHPSITYQVTALDIHSCRITLFSQDYDDVELHISTGGIQHHCNNCHRKYNAITTDTQITSTTTFAIKLAKIHYY